ncbi:MAG: response regulator [Leptolyngbyaceae cyanobacterium CSU_1_4]|nr:response regulator [Leptolyngbyaceae cyanobacterium CSU_1_4]
MGVDQVPLPVNRSQLLLIDEDSEFCLRLRVCLEQYADLELALEDSDGSKTIQILENARGFSTSLLESSSTLPAAENIALIILNIHLGRSNPSSLQGLPLCQRIKGQCPHLPVLLITSSPNVDQLNEAHRAGANGYCAKGLGAESLVAIIRRVLGGQDYWMPLQDGALPNFRSAPRSVRSPLSTQRPLIRSGILNHFRTQLQQSSVRQIDDVMNAIINELENPDLSLLERAIVAGRYRELRAARWLVTRLLTPEASPSGGAPPLANAPTDRPGFRFSSPSISRQLSSFCSYSSHSIHRDRPSLLCFY